MPKKQHPIIKCIVKVDNDGADTLSCLDIDNLDFNTIDWKNSFPKLKYNDRKMKKVEQNVCMQICNIMSCCDFECYEFNGEFPYPMAAEKEFADREFPLDVRTMKEHQDKNTNIQKLRSLYYQGS